MDHAGTTIYTRSLIEQFSAKMISNLYGNPHSGSAPAKLSREMIDSVRVKALRFLGADPKDFDLVFTANSTAAIKLVAESFQDVALASSAAQSFWYGYHKDAHTSLVGVREYTNSSFHCFGSDTEVDNWLQGYHLNSTLEKTTGMLRLFAYPGQSNMTGRRLPLSWTRQLRQSSLAHHQDSYSLLDAAALATTAELEFNDPESAPDFTVVSFYKIFGFPDLGGLIVRKKSGHILSWRKYFGGGTVNMLTVLHEATVQRKDSTIHDGLEDGTLPFHSILALDCAIDDHKRLYGSMKTVAQHTAFLIRRLYAGLSRLSYIDGRSLCTIYHNTSSRDNFDADPKTQGATMAFNVVQADGTYLGHSVVEKLANDKGIYLRAGGLCNPGGIASALNIEPWQIKRAWAAGCGCGKPGALEIVNGRPTGVVRASLGAMTTVKDVDSLLYFLSDTFVQPLVTHPLQALAETFKETQFTPLEPTENKTSQDVSETNSNIQTPSDTSDTYLNQQTQITRRESANLLLGQ
jgi:molybdenum cofactor sulfurtransferase